jgi:glutamine synthetase
VSDDVFHWTQEERESHGVDTLPGTLEEALNELAKDEIVRCALGDRIYTVYDRAKRAEWDEYRIHVTSWEVDRYLWTL